MRRIEAEDDSAIAEPDGIDPAIRVRQFRGDGLGPRESLIARYCGTDLPDSLSGSHEHPQRSVCTFEDTRLNNAVVFSRHRDGAHAAPARASVVRELNPCCPSPVALDRRPRHDPAVGELYWLVLDGTE